MEMRRIELWARLLEPLTLADALRLRVASSVFDSAAFCFKWRLNVTEVHALFLDNKWDLLELIIFLLRGWFSHVKHLILSRKLDRITLQLYCQTMLSVGPEFYKLEIINFVADQKAFDFIMEQFQVRHTLREVSLHPANPLGCIAFMTKLLQQVGLTLVRLDCPLLIECLRQSHQSTLKFPNLNSVKFHYQWGMVVDELDKCAFLATHFISDHPKVRSLDVKWILEPNFPEIYLLLYTDFLPVWILKSTHHPKVQLTLRFSFTFLPDKADALRVYNEFNPFLHQIDEWANRIDHLELDFQQMPNLTDECRKSIWLPFFQSTSIQTLILRPLATVLPFNLSTFNATQRTLKTLELDFSYLTSLFHVPNLITSQVIYVHCITFSKLHFNQDVSLDAFEKIIAFLWSNLKNLSKIQFKPISYDSYFTFQDLYLREVVDKYQTSLLELVLASNAPRPYFINTNQGVFANLIPSGKSGSRVIYVDFDRLTKKDKQLFQQFFQQIGDWSYWIHLF